MKLCSRRHPEMKVNMIPALFIFVLTFSLTACQLKSADFVDGDVNSRRFDPFPVLAIPRCNIVLRDLSVAWSEGQYWGESAKGTSPSAALRTQREPLSSLGSHYPTIGLTPSFQCGNMPGCILAISPSLCSARLLWCLSFLYFLIAHKQSLRLMCFNVGYIADL